MQILIPMTGYGSRFVAAGYNELKPFIKVYEHPIIEWIVKGMYPGETNITFICRSEHLLTQIDMEKNLRSICPSCKILAINNWEKKGPVYDVMRIADHIDDDEPAIINYCDFYMAWDYDAFKIEVKKRECTGAIPCYTGFHPNLLPEANIYASCKFNENEELIEIKEKFSFEENKQNGSHSVGTYYFSSGNILKKYCQRLIDERTELNGEYYASLPYNNMVKSGLKVWVANIVKYFCQWGTPEDLKEFFFWNNMIREWKK